LFSEYYKKERFLQQVDNINTIYVAMTRAALGMHLIAKTPGTKINDFSHILYRFAQETDMEMTSEDGVENYCIGSLPDFEAHHKAEETGDIFVRSTSDAYPSFPLDGRLKFAADSIDYFSADGQAGISASGRIKGIVFHDILSQVQVPEDLGQAVKAAAARGDISTDQIEEVMDLLSERISQVESRGWFNTPGAEILNEISLIDVDGQVYRPDRVVKAGDKIMIVDYKFGEHHKVYERQMKKYAEIWRGMGYEDVSTYLWYVQTGVVIG
jgi:ATP-dependent exoDNAse (exonuclease V) beta subunit